MRVDRDKLAVGLGRLPLFDKLVAHCAGKMAYVVGGAIRDALIGIEVRDLDLIFPHDPTATAQSFAKAHGGHWFWLDEQRRQSRVVTGRDGTCLIFDFAPFRASSLDLDLADRDFTINAMALTLLADLGHTPLVDPAGGLDDLRMGLLRMVSPEAFANDPLRMVKGVRHATTLGLKIDEHTLACMQAEMTELHRVAPERIRQEFWKILACEDATRGLHLLSESLVGNYLFGNAFSQMAGELAESLIAIRGCWHDLSAQQPVVKDWLGYEVEQGLNYATLLLWTILLSRLDGDLPGLLAEEWLLSRKAQTYVKAVAGIDGETLEELTNVSRQPRAFAWWAHGHRVEPKLWLLSLAAVAALWQPGGSASIGQWVPVVETLDDLPPDDLVDGHWLRHELGLPDGPAMSRALELLRKAEISGLVDSTESAREYLLRQRNNID